MSGQPTTLSPIGPIAVVRLGCIDIGSNTTRLLVADRDGGG